MTPLSDIGFNNFISANPQSDALRGYEMIDFAPRPKKSQAAGEQAPPAKKPPAPQFQPTVPPRPESEDDGFTLLIDLDRGAEEDPRLAAQSEAEQIKEQAGQELEVARREGEQIRRQAYEEGYQQGQSEGAAASRAKVEAVCDNLNHALTELGQAQAKVLAVMERELVALVLAVVDRILLGAEALTPQVVGKVVREAINRLGDTEKITVRLSSADLAEMEKIRPSLTKEGASLHLVGDPELQPGDVVVQSPVVQVDATVATRRQRVFDLLEDSFRRGQPLDMQQIMASPWPQEEPEPEPEPAAASPSDPPQGDEESW